MHQITAQQFEDAIQLDPAWASKLTEPVEITGICDIHESKITHLSPLLHFTGRDEDGSSARFIDCKHLKIAEGTFAGRVNFSGSGIEKIGELVITQPGKKQVAASFYECANLKVAEGTFPGFVNFAESGVEKIGNLIITQPNTNKEAASFVKCPNLKVAEGTFPGGVSFTGSAIERIGKLIITEPNVMGEAARLLECKKLTLPKTWLERTDISRENQLVERSKLQIQHEADARKAMKQPSFEL